MRTLQLTAENLLEVGVENRGPAFEYQVNHYDSSRVVDQIILAHEPGSRCLQNGVPSLAGVASLPSKLGVVAQLFQKMLQKNRAIHVGVAKRHACKHQALEVRAHDLQAVEERPSHVAVGQECGAIECEDPVG